MRRVCAWSGKQINPQLDHTLSDNLISHGICEDCRRSVFSDNNGEMVTFLEGISEPVFVLDRNFRVIKSNAAARKISEKEIEEIDGFLGGEVFECVNSSKPGGCGNTDRCGGCSIRRAIRETYETGKGKTNAPVHLDQTNNRGERKRTFLVTTEKRDGIVLLRIDQAE